MPRLRLSSFLSLTVIVLSLVSANVEQSENEINDNVIEKTAHSIKESGGLKIMTQLISNAFRLLNLRKVVTDVQSGKWSTDACMTCKFGLAMAEHLIEFGRGKDDIASITKTLCKTLHIETDRVCDGVVDQFKDELDYIRRHTALNRNEMCGVIFGVDCARRATKNLNWTISIPEKRHFFKRRSNIAYKPIDEKHASVVHLTDIHIDPYYIPGTNADCGEPLCCRAADGVASDPIRAAGVWGDYRSCDTPIATLINALKHISDTHSDALYWMWTGDIAPHDIWNVTRAEVLSQIRLVTDLMKQYSRGLPVYPVVGNHEGVPVNSFPPPEVKGEHSISWLYDTLADQWSYWLPKEAVKTLRYGGYYSVKHRPGLRVVCINTNYCARLNPWTLLNPIDPANQLQWLADELYRSELDGDRVHIIGHSPPDNRECTQAWLYNYLRIIDRFRHTVLAQYYGHTHRDEFRLFYSPNDESLPIGLGYVGPSITPFTDNNPSYRLYYMDGDGYLVDHETFYFNLTEANRGRREPIWKQEYRALHTFNMTSMSPHGWHELLNKLKSDDQLFQHYYRLYYRQSDVRKSEFCNFKCKRIVLSDLIVSNAFETKPKGFDW